MRDHAKSSCIFLILILFFFFTFSFEVCLNTFHSLLYDPGLPWEIKMQRTGRMEKLKWLFMTILLIIAIYSCVILVICPALMLGSQNVLLTFPLRWHDNFIVLPSFFYKYDVYSFLCCFVFIDFVVIALWIGIVATVYKSTFNPSKIFTGGEIKAKATGEDEHFV